MALTLLYSEGYMLHVLKSSVISCHIIACHNCHSVPYNQLSEQSIPQLTLYYTKCLING